MEHRLPVERLLVVVNRAAGTASEEALAAAQEVWREHPVAVELVGTSSPGELDEVLAARVPGARLVVVGGDGSLHAVANALERSATGLDVASPVGVVPLGTGNDLARCLGVPLDPTEAARVVLDGRPRDLDVLVDDDGGLVVNAVHVGVGVVAAEEAGAWKERLGAVGYAVGSVVAGARAEGWAVRVEVDGATVSPGDEPVLMVGVGVGTSIGGGALLTPEAHPDDGLADVVVSSSTGWLERLSYAVSLKQGEHLDREDVRHVTGREVVVTGEDFGTNADGELAGPFRSRRWRVRERAWSLVVPA